MAAIIFIFVAVGVGGGRYLLNRSNSCGFCHEMKPEIVTWQASAHSKIECSECHGSVTGKLAYRNGFFKEVASHFQNAYLLPITMDRPISNLRCMKCHSGKRHVSPSGDLKIPHDKHTQKGISCSECHRGVAHGNLALRQLTIDGNFNRWTPAVGREEMTGVNTGISMTACLECHRSKRVTLSCEACHREIVKPADHKVSDWAKLHGKLARKDIKSCDKCHSYTVDFEITNIKDAVTEYVQTNTFCRECHLKRPQDHSDQWSAMHGAAANSDKKGCFVCHSRTRPMTSFKGTKTFCTQCHQGKHLNFNREVHPIPVPPGTKPGLSCQQCHSLKVCTRCHTNLSSKQQIKEEKPNVNRSSGIEN